MAKEQLDVSKESFNLPASWGNVWKICAGLGLLGLAGAGFGMFSDPKRAAFSWLFGFYVFLAIALGSLFFVIVQRLVGAHWSVTVRRTAEFLASGLPVLAVLWVPILLLAPHLFPWLGDHGHGGGHDTPHVVGQLEIVPAAHAAQHGDAPKPADHAAPAKAPAAAGGHDAKGGSHGAATAGDAAHAGHGALGDPHDLEHAELMEKKKPYLNKSFFMIRAVIYLAIWSLLGSMFFAFSAREDREKGVAWTLKAQRWAPVSMILFAFSLTFAAFDWLMSLDPAWPSTIFGVNIFSAAVVSALATMIVVTMALRGSAAYAKAVNTEHYHDLGKLLIGFVCFWAYISFSQFMLIWYAALPEETPFFHKRWDVSIWSQVSLALIVGHFVFPFFFLLSRNVKRNLGMLRLGALFILVMHVVDMYWFVMPNVAYNTGIDPNGFAPSWMDAAALIAVGGIYFGFVFYRMTKYPLIPVGDPRLARSLAFQNA
ncbi:MAG: hypothetical protein JNL38_40340 [Myxococcales bacterium]|nr:hypothetical protein [Myxococcales bacterium]